MWNKRASVMCSSIFFTLFLCLLLELGYSQDFGFPEAEEDKSMRNADNRKPLYIPNRCKENEYLYPGDQKDDWVCDCQPGFVYVPDSDKCFLIYRQGPCSNNQFLVLPPKKVIPACANNPCLRDGWVRFQNKCYELEKSGPCALPELSYVVGVNVTTFEVQCQPASVALNNRFSDDELQQFQAPGEIPYCAQGSKRYIEGKC